MIDAQPGWPALVNTFQKQKAETTIPITKPGSEANALTWGGTFSEVSCAKNTNGMRLIRDIIVVRSWRVQSGEPDRNGQEQIRGDGNAVQRAEDIETSPAICCK